MSRPTNRRWAVAGGLLLAAATLVNTIITARLSREFGRGYDAGMQRGRDAAQDIEIGFLRAYRETHEAEARPLINLLIPMAEEWPRMRDDVREMHDFLVRRFHMPTRLQEPPGPPDAGLYARELPAP